MSLHWQETRVKCYSSRTYAERPDSFAYQDMIYKVEQIEREWQEPCERHFRVRTQDSKLFKLCYNDQKDEWLLKELISDQLKKHE